MQNRCFGWQNYKISQMCLRRGQNAYHCWTPVAQVYNFTAYPQGRKRIQRTKENMVLQVKKPESSNSSVNWGNSQSPSGLPWQLQQSENSRLTSDERGRAQRANTAIGQSGVKSLLLCPIMCFIYSRDTEHTGTNYPSSSDPNSAAFSPCTHLHTGRDTYAVLQNGPDHHRVPYTVPAREQGNSLSYQRRLM